MTVRIEVEPSLLTWARARSGLDAEVFVRRFPRYESWLAGESQPTLRQLQEFARKTYTPVGFLFLSEPPVEQVPIPDFRTVADRQVLSGQRSVVSADLLDTVYAAQARQEWFRDSQLLNGEDPLTFVASLGLTMPIEQAAGEIRETLDWHQDLSMPSWEAALRLLRERAEAVGVLVSIAGMVGANTSRKLDPDDFRGFALVDSYAPLVFVNGADSKAAQIFTLAHELAHIWLGESALSDVDPISVRDHESERWCNQVAAELLVPMAEFRQAFDPEKELRGQLGPLAARFRVSTQVILGQVREAGWIDWTRFVDELRAERERVAAIVTEEGGGGNYYNSRPVQIGKRFAREVIVSTLEGHTTYKEAFSLLGIRKTSTFEGLGRQLGVM